MGTQILLLSIMIKKILIHYIGEKSKKLGKKIIEFDFNNKIFRNIVVKELKRKAN